MDQYGIQYEIPVKGSTRGTQPRVEVYWFERNREPVLVEGAARDVLYYQIPILCFLVLMPT